MKGGQMKLKINASYLTVTGEYIIPRSHMAQSETGAPEKYIVVEVLTGGKTSYTRRHTTMSLKELKQALDLKKNEKVEVI